MKRTLYAVVTQSPEDSHKIQLPVKTMTEDEWAKLGVDAPFKMAREFAHRSDMEFHESLMN